MNKVLYFVVLILASCVPYPHKVRIFPEINGTFYVAGSGVENIQVNYTNNPKENPCTSGNKTVFTGPGGEFKIEAEYEQAYFVAAGIMHILRYWHLCFKDDSNNHYEWSDRVYGPRNAPEKITIKCDRAALPLCRVL